MIFDSTDYFICRPVRFCLTAAIGVDASFGTESIRPESTSSTFLLPDTSFLMDLVCSFGLAVFWARVPIDLRGIFELAIAVSSLVGVTSGLTKAFFAGLALGLGLVDSSSSAT